MLRKVNYNNIIIEYDFQRKNVKNINLRVKPDLSVTVSANKRVSLKYIDEFVIRKGDFILSAQKKYSAVNNEKLNTKFSENEFNQYINDCFNYVYSLFVDKIKEKPVLKMKTMTSRWGSCNYVKYIITLNTNLIFCSKEQIFYVIVHEFAHLLVHNHSKGFYKVVEEYCKDYKEISKELSKIYIKRS